MGFAVLALALYVLFDLERSTRGSEPGAAPEARPARAKPVELTTTALTPPVTEREAQPLREETKRAAIDIATAAPERPPVATAVAKSPEPSLEVLLVDANDLPVQRVLLRLELESTSSSSGPRTTHHLTTDANGSARLPLSWFTAARAPGGSARNVLYASVPIAPAPSLDFGATVPAPGVVTMRLPPAGHVLVRVNEDDGTPVAGGATVYGLTAGGLSFNASVHDGLAELSWIGLGERLELRAVYDDQHTRPSNRSRARLASPEWAGETIEVELVLGREWPLVDFRVLDEQGRTLGFANLVLKINEEQLTAEVARCVADADGRAQVRLTADHRSSFGRTLELAVESPVARRAEIALPPELEVGRATDLGTIVLRPSRRSPR